MKSKTAKPAAKAAMPMNMMSGPKPGTREHRDMQRAEFNAKMDAQKKGQK